MEDGHPQSALISTALAEDLRTLDPASVPIPVHTPEPVPGDLPPARCAVCAGRVGVIVDHAALAQGDTFTVLAARGADCIEAWQFSSTDHEMPFHALLPLDAVCVLERAAKCAEWLAHHARALFQVDPAQTWLTVSRRRGPGGHDGLRIRLWSREPTVHRRERERTATAGGSRAQHLEIAGNEDHLLGEFRGGLVASIAEPASRSLETLIWFRPSARGELFRWNGDQRWGMAQALREVSGAIALELHRRRLPIRFQWTLHGARDADAYAHLVTPASTRVSDSPQTWASLLRAHLGLE